MATFLKKQTLFPVIVLLGFLDLKRIVASILSLVIFSLLVSCETKNRSDTASNKDISNAVIVIDSLVTTSEVKKAIVLLDSIRPIIQSDDILNLTDYYFYKGTTSPLGLATTTVYADSAIRLYDDASMQQRYTNGYLKALIFKADTYLRRNQYDNALAALFKIKPLLSPKIDNVIFSNYLTKIADINYGQKRFRVAAGYYKQAYDALSKAESLSQPSIYYKTQILLNNSAFSYENAGLLDSAETLYREGFIYVDKEAKRGIIIKDRINASRIVLLDNLGGLLAKKGNFIAAEKLLEESVSINDGIVKTNKATAYLKLADTYGKLGKTDKADSTFNIAEKLIYADTADQSELKLRLQKAKSDWLFLKQDYKEAFVGLNKYHQLTDSTNEFERSLSQSDLKLKFENLQTKEDVVNLEKTNENKNAYLIALGLFLMMLAPIIVLILKNTRQSGRAEKAIVKHNIVLEQTMKRLELRNKDYAKMMKVMAHDLKNPIGGMVGVANLLLEDDRFVKEDKELLHLIESSGENAIEMINQLLNSGLAVENEELKKENVDLQHLLRQCTELLQYKADEKRQKIIFVSGGPVIASLSKEKIWRVFNNLIVNAIKFSPENAEIKVVLEHLAKSVKISIIDQGIGVPQNDKEKIFEMFTSAKRPGTAGEQPFGIGLSISKQIIESHDGKIWLDDNPLGGTIFYVEMPVLNKLNQKKTGV